MEIEKKEAVKLLLQGRQYVLTLLHTLFGKEPTRETLKAAASEDSLSAIKLFDLGEGSGAALLMEALKPLQTLTDDALEAIRQEYTKLFLGPEELIAPPWESVYTTKARALFQESTLEVRNWYGCFGYQPAGYPNYPDDHISLMLHFLALLTEEALACLETCMEGYKNFLEAQKEFAQSHLLNWLPRYASDMNKSDTCLLYPPLAAALCRLMEEDQAFLKELVQVA